MKVPFVLIGMCIAVVALIGGCDSEDASLVRNEKSLEVEGAFSAEVTLCRKVGSKSGRRIGAGTEFRMGKKSYVRAFVDFMNVKPDRPYTVHLVWIRPDGREMFRKYGEVRQSAAESGGYQTVVRWLDAEDLHSVKSDTLVGESPDFTMDSRLNISFAREREPGDYRFRVYLDRALLKEESFTVDGPQTAILPSTIRGKG